MRFKEIGICLSLGVVCATIPAAAAVLRVDCESGPFADIGAAVAAAGPGDTVLVERCAAAPYPPFQVIDKQGVHILSALADVGGAGSLSGGAPAASFRPSVAIDGGGDFQCILIDNSVDVTLQGFAIRGCGFHAIEVLGSVDTTVIGNRIDGGLETIRDQGSSHSRYLGNLIAGALFAFFLDGDDALVSGNRVVNDRAIGIVILNSGNHIVGNDIFSSAAEGIEDQADGSRIERNRVLGNGGRAQIVLNPGSSDADVIGNVTGGSIADFGSGTDLADNR